jgi:methyltransferase (TIGR00027 family)
MGNPLDFLPQLFHGDREAVGATPSANDTHGPKEDAETPGVHAGGDLPNWRDIDVGKTAKWTALIRGQLGVDKYGKYLAGRRAKLWQSFVGRELEPFNEYIAVRSLWGDKFYNLSAWNLRARFPHQPVQIVDVASGYSSRPFRLSWPKAAQYYELDQPFILEDKRTLLEQIGQKPKVTHLPVPTNLKFSWEEDLKRAGFNPTLPSVWMLDGILTYLDTAGAEALLEKVSSLAPSGSFLGADLLSREQFTSRPFQTPLQLLELLGSPWRFFVDNPHAFFTQYGWLGRVLDMHQWKAQEPILSQGLRRRALRNQLSFLMVEARKL